MQNLFGHHTDAISLLREDHVHAKDLFNQFEEAESTAEKQEICAKVINALKIHTAIEEEIFYPAIREFVGKEIATEADEEHHVAKMLIAELEMMAAENEHFDAKFRVLAENVRHHIKEEEGQMFPKVKAADLNLEDLGTRMRARKSELQQSGVDTFAEEEVAAMHPNADSPANASRTHWAG